MTFDLPDGLVRRLKLRAVRDGRSLKDVAAAVLRAGLASQTAAPAEDAREGLTAKLIEGLASGTPIPFTRNHFAKKKAALARNSGQNSRRS